MALSCRHADSRANRSRAKLSVVLLSIVLRALTPLCPLVLACSAQTPGAKAFVADVVSGTYCSASGCFNAAGGTYVTNMTLSIDGEVVKTYTYGVTDNIHHAEWHLGVTWASTHFIDGFMIPVRTWGKDSAGDEREDTKSTYVYNKGYVLGNQALAPYSRDGARRVRVRCSSLNHTVFPPTLDEGMDDDKATILPSLPWFTLFYIQTHGNPGQFKDCPDAALVFWDEVLSGNTAKQPNQPPYNFVLVDGCNTGVDDTLARGFEVVNPNGSAVPSRAFLGWQTLILGSFHNNDWRDLVWQGLIAGDTIWGAVLFAATGGHFPDAQVFDDNAARPAIYRDANMKLAGVYGGNAGQWYR
jgi:hypothetical protein